MPAFSCPGGDRDRIRAELGTPAETVVIVHVGRIEAIKGHAVLLDALGRIRKVPGWLCWFVGGAQRPAEESLLNELRGRPDALGIADRIRFLGQRPDVRAVLAAADVYCQPNIGPEGFGLTFVEALYSGLPVVTSGIGGAAEIVDATCGVLTHPGDVTAVAEALETLIRDPAWRRELGQAGPARAAALCDPARQLHRLATLLGSDAIVPTGLRGPAPVR